MKEILIFIPHQAVSMSVSIIKDICWVASHYYAQEANASIENTVKLVAEDKEPLQCFNGTRLSVDGVIQDIDPNNAAALFVGAFWGSPRPILERSKSLIKLLPKLHELDIPIIAVSNGSYFVAEAGLLNNKIATIYPPSATQFQQLYPNVELQIEKAITNINNVYCSNGIASGCDLAIAIIERLYGPQIARKISQEFLIGFSRDYDIANVQLDGKKYHRDPLLSH